MLISVSFHTIWPWNMATLVVCFVVLESRYLNIYLNLIPTVIFQWDIRKTDPYDAYDLVDLGVSYKFNLGGQKLVLRGNVFNVFDVQAIQQTDRFGVINTNGLTYNGSIRYEF